MSATSTTKGEEKNGFYNFDRRRRVRGRPLCHEYRAGAELRISLTSKQDAQCDPGGHDEGGTTTSSATFGPLALNVCLACTFGAFWRTKCITFRRR